ncbi:MAG: transcriptional regulator [SAR86 cluster bacterium]|uniref:Transcriptional regulator n=1 Tax=SAR86 cluster bacterium TaxID=2030880 RepID=A0A2A4X717_9GAMM|nr:MAG: transcriptional regulator [SAR86 cluster bacterium]
MKNSGYKQFCPVAMASEILCTRWTLVLLRELIAGSTRFNDLRRGVPKMSPSLLSKRLAELEEAGVLIRKQASRKPAIYEYLLTDAGRDLHNVVESVGIWGQKWVSTKSSLENLDPSLLMWDMRRNLNPTPLPESGAIIQFFYSNLPKSKQSWWLIVEVNGAVDLCWSDPGKQVDLLVETDLKTITAIWMGMTTVKEELGNITLKGDKKIAVKMQKWLGLSPFAAHANRSKIES